MCVCRKEGAKPPTVFMRYLKKSFQGHTSWWGAPAAIFKSQEDTKTYKCGAWEHDADVSRKIVQEGGGGGKGVTRHWTGVKSRGMKMPAAPVPASSIPQPYCECGRRRPTCTRCCHGQGGVRRGSSQVVKRPASRRTAPEDRAPHTS